MVNGHRISNDPSILHESSESSTDVGEYMS